MRHGFIWIFQVLFFCLRKNMYFCSVKTLTSGRDSGRLKSNADFDLMYVPEPWN